MATKNFNVGDIVRMKHPEHWPDINDAVGTVVGFRERDSIFTTGVGLWVHFPGTTGAMLDDVWAVADTDLVEALDTPSAP